MSSCRSGRQPPPGSLTRQLGQRVVVRRPDEVVLAEKDDWLVVEVTGWSTAIWTSCKVLYKQRSSKNVYYVGVRADTGVSNRSTSVGLLEAKHPGVLEWVIEVVKRTRSSSHVTQ